MFYLGFYVRFSPPKDGAAIGGAGYVALVAVYLFAAAFQFGWGPVCWIYVSEIPTSRLRGLNVSLAAATQWLFNFVVARAVPVMLKTVGSHGYGTYFIFGCFCACMVVIAWFFVPETKGVSLERMDELFGVASFGDIEDVGVAAQHGDVGKAVEEVDRTEDVRNGASALTNSLFNNISSAPGREPYMPFKGTLFIRPSDFSFIFEGTILYYISRLTCNFDGEVLGDRGSSVHPKVIKSQKACHRNKSSPSAVVFPPLGITNLKHRSPSPPPRSLTAAFPAKWLRKPPPPPYLQPACHASSPQSHSQYSSSPSAPSCPPTYPPASHKPRSTHTPAAEILDPDLPRT
ncbi:hypothetical protein KC331_g58 [Hortaea werneckii]|nr:hypothetical protein KC331_g58 [Hortaea werneckii]